VIRIIVNWERKTDHSRSYLCAHRTLRSASAAPHKLQHTIQFSSR